jgi:hypothetical protein
VEQFGAGSRAEGVETLPGRRSNSSVLTPEGYVLEASSPFSGVPVRIHSRTLAQASGTVHASSQRYVVSMRTLTFVVPDPPPLREHPGRSAGRGSPYAAALMRAGEAAREAHPDAFPFEFTGMTVRYGRTVWNVDVLGYQPDHAILEVLANVGAVWDPEAWWSYASQDRDADYYVVTFTSEDASSDRPGPSPITAWTEVPAEFRGS